MMAWLSRWLTKLGPLLFGLVTFLFSLATLGIPATYAADDPDHHFNGWAFVLFAAVCGLTAAFSRRYPWGLYAAAVLGFLAFTMWFPVMIAAYRGAMHFTRRRDSVIFLAAGFALIIVPITYGAAQNGFSWGWIPGGMVSIVLVAFPYLAGLWVSARRQIVAGLRDRAARLEHEQEQRAELARVDERSRIAREMHDVVAHRVSLMVLHAGALEVSTADEKIAAEAGLIRTTGREALAELRQVLGVLRTDPAQLAPPPSLSDLDALLERTRAAGQPVQLIVDGEAAELPLTVQRTAYRVIQEALTNVVKHAPGADTVVTLRHLPEAVEVKVDNTPGRGSVTAMPGSGLGLIGLRERVALLYGRFEARPRLDGGFTVSALLPAVVQK